MQLTGEGVYDEGVCTNVHLESSFINQCFRDVNFSGCLTVWELKVGLLGEGWYPNRTGCCTQLHTVTLLKASYSHVTRLKWNVDLSFVIQTAVDIDDQYVTWFTISAVTESDNESTAAAIRGLCVEKRTAAMKYLRQYPQHARCPWWRW